MRIFNIPFAATLAATLASASIASAQYGLVDNFNGTGRNGDGVNLYANGTGFFAGGGAGGGGGESPGDGPDSSKAFVAGGAIGGGFIGFSTTVADTVGGDPAVDITQVVNGMETTGLVLDFKDNQADGDGYAVRLESGDFANSRTYAIPNATTDTWRMLSIPLAGDVTYPATDAGTFNPAAITAIVVLPTVEVGGNHDYRVDNIGFLSNRVPTVGDIEDFQDESAGALTIGADLAPTAATNLFGGMTAGFTFGGDTISTAEVVDLGAGDLAGRWSFSGGNSGILFDLGPAEGSQSDVSAYDTIRLDLAVGEAGDEVIILLEDAFAVDFGERCTFTPAVTTTLTTIDIPMASLTCGAQGLATAQSWAQRLTVLTSNDQGNGIEITVDNVQLIDSSASVTNWRAVD
ncbi:MAG: hypothetical protein RLY93_01565 [Sumerlaeia bacterium]